jgi:hypothetical protein
VIALLVGAALMHTWDERASRVAARHEKRPPHFAQTFHAARFVRGNLHTHTTKSDGDTSPEEVVRWYRDHGYGFVALTDHNALSSPGLAALDTSDFTVIPGEEVSMYVHGKQVHVNALCTRAVVPGGDFETSAAALGHALEAILAQGGVALVNHPNFDWALTKRDLVSADGEQLVEIASGHPYVHAGGDTAHPSHEQLWDDALSAGHDVMGVAVDDMHQLVTDRDPEAFPGVGWVEVFADGAGESPICDALRRGALYASTGAELASVRVTEDTYNVVPLGEGAAVVFIGSGGRVLRRAQRGERSADYRVTGDEGYVRARVETAAGVAWTPAVRVKSE